jgi:hypothetical protein
MQGLHLLQSEDKERGHRKFMRFSRAIQLVQKFSRASAPNYEN